MNDLQLNQLFTYHLIIEEGEDEKDEDELKLSKGMSVVKENYWHFRNDESMSTKQKLAKSMTEIRNRMTEIEKLVKYNVKLKKVNKILFKRFPF